ncbi:LIC13305 family lipoprotein [Leptospira mayottensis]|uniref:LIC13305 family lipoprotein n=1 Tax=Leptospira mayottensis TaxID=1137606 RepID=UPI0002BE7769|nr:hypothetical protein [Leptospira mayottensis]AXR62813.1 hypothetical protein DQM68_19375 [Leptospira mayottensis]AZQ03960.1 hypothetical protein LEP1GSC190_17970 [Leptospira mayottensis 200901116]TGN17757.1 hypothetical protein EHR03_01430 [Leptospira mayottensis]
MKIRFVFFFLILISLVACNEKKNEIDPDLLLSVALLQPPDRAENYDRDVQIITHTLQGFPVDCDLSYSDEDVNFFVERLKREIARYPRGYWIKAGAESIVLCRNLTILGNLQAGAVNPMLPFIFLSVWDGIASNANRQVFNGSTYVNYFDYYYNYDPRRVISHELTHSVDRRNSWHILSDPEWERLNHPGFQYGNHNYNPQDSILRISNPIRGFVSYYATLNHLEDRAEIGMVIMGPQAANNQLVQICQNDAIVAAKVRKTVSEWKQFWPFAGAENTEWKVRMSQAERDCS